MANSPQLVCITPIKNESWILEKFLTATSLWADRIILADQKSTDDSVAIASRFEKVTVIENKTDYNEFERTRLMLNEARKIEGPKIIFALDADEILAANYLDSPEWQTLLNAKSGTVMLFDRVNLTPDLNHYFGSLKMAMALVDDGVTTMESTATSILHNIRLPWPTNAVSYYFKDLKVLHYDFVLPERTLSKMRWYQCFEKVKFGRDDLQLLKKYPFFERIEDLLEKMHVQPVPTKWFDNFRTKGIDVTSLRPPVLWWDDEVLKMMAEHGMETFRMLDVHTLNWEALAEKKGVGKPRRFRIQRSLIDKVLLRYWRRFKL